MKEENNLQEGVLRHRLSQRLLSVTNSLRRRKVSSES